MASRATLARFGADSGSALNIWGSLFTWKRKVSSWRCWALRASSGQSGSAWCMLGALQVFVLIFHLSFSSDAIAESDASCKEWLAGGSELARGQISGCPR